LQFGYADDFFLQQQFSPPKGSIRYVQFGRRFEIGRLRHSQLTAVEERQECAAFHFPTEVGVDIDDPAADERRDVGQRVLVRLYGSWKIPEGAELPALERLYGDSSRFHLFRRQSNHAGVRRGGRRIRPGGIGRRAIASGEP